MPFALLLSPDDQAVSAITSVLEEMSVTCERPLDGMSAAKQMSSRNFDLVLVDCENLPAAKLIFDVCRRGKAGNNPIPIAIVDGHAGLPTAFRLGAELILTKPVAKDQARTTIRTAVSRIKKEEPVSQEEPKAEVGATLADVAAEPTVATSASQVEGLLPNHEISPPVSQAMPALKAMGAAATSGAPAVTTPSRLSEPLATPNRPAAQGPNVAALPEFKKADRIAEPSIPPVHPKSKDAEGEKLGEDPVFAELDQPKVQKTDLQADVDAQAPIFSSYSEKQNKSRGPLVALLIVTILAGGLYAAWMYVPEFRALAQPQVERALALVGVGRPEPKVIPLKPVAQSAPTPTPAQTSQPDTAATTQPAPEGASAGSSPAAAGTASTAFSPSAAPSTTTVTGAVAQPAAAGENHPDTPAKSEALKPEAVKSQPVQASANHAVDTKNAASSTDTELPGEKDSVILSSRGAERRLIHAVRSVYPAAARATGAEGTVVLKAVIDETGKVRGARALEGDPVLAAAAIAAVKQYRYRPYVRDGRVFPFQTIVLVDFPRR